MSAADPLTDFLAQRVLAVVGVSRDPAKWGTIVFRDLRSKGYTVYPVNPHMKTLDGAEAFASLSDLPEPVGGVVIVTQPRVTLEIVREAADLGVRRVWMQQGAESPEAIALCEEHGISTVHGVCVMVKSR
ncbi:CoA-binding protein [Candidatus Sumerlaeota bacterium]|nr:CoA-binding protein [Candidatus Sumerlaeota bacterium]